ncbi:hypothetical protein OH77DRAFT_111275 [Trametes cingulata]|nr:hypothetical protein OH77DRAFT_111275 [Trametes cingulata]
MDVLPPTAGGPPPGLELGQTFGVMLLSTIIASALYGITTLQTLYYYDRFPGDSWMMKTAVAAVWVLDTATIVLDSHAVYYYLIVNYNNPLALLDEVWSAQIEVLITYTVVIIAQIFFILRIYQLRRHAWYIPAALGLLALASYAIVIVIVRRILEHSQWSDVQTDAVNNPLIANWALGMVVDIGITVVLCWYLWSEKTYVRQNTHRVLNRIIIFSVNRGAIAAVVQIFTLLTKFWLPQNLVWLAFHNALSKVYANSMLATLNSRVALRDMMSGSEIDGSQLGTQATLPTIRHGRPGVKPPRGHNHQLATLQFARSAHSSTLDQGTTDSAESMDQGVKAPALGEASV